MSPEMFAMLSDDLRKRVADELTAYRDEAKADGHASWEKAQAALDQIKMVEAELAALHETLQ